jgi:hypothetical protein
VARVAAIVVAYAALTAFLTWPLPAQIATHLPDTSFGCRTDTLVSAFVLSHDSQALLEAPARLPHAGVYHPTPLALFYGESSFGALPLFLPLFAATGNPVFALNGLYLVSLSLTLASMHLLGWRWTGSHAAAAIGGLTLATTRWLFWWTATSTMYAVLFWIPLILSLTVDPGVVRGRVWRLALLLVLQATGTPYVGLGVLLPLAFLALIRTARSETRAGGVQLVGALALASMLLVPAYVGYFMVRLQNPLLETQSYWAASLQALAVWLPWGLLDRDRPTGIALIVIPLIAIGAALFRARRDPTPVLRQRWLHAGYWAAAGIFICFAPSAQWGSWSVPLPQALLWKLPFLGTIRVPHRLGVAALFGIAALAALAFAECSRRLVSATAGDTAAMPVARRRASAVTFVLALLVGGAMYLDYDRGVPLPLPPNYLPVPPVYPIQGPLPDRFPTRVPPDPGTDLLPALASRQGALVELPIGVGSVGAPESQAKAMFRAIFHRRPILNGYTSYWPKEHPARMDLVRRLPDPVALARLAREADLAFVLVRLADMPPVARSTWDAIAGGSRSDLRLVARSGDDVLFAVDAPAGTVVR